MNKEQLDKVCNKLSEGDLLCQIAEEASELAQAAVKLYRAIYNKNPTTVTDEEATHMMYEEIGDVRNAVEAWMHKIYGDEKIITESAEAKAARWVDRLENGVKKNEKSDI